MSDGQVSAPLPRFRPGDAVEILRARSLGHCRTPSYLKGNRGTVIQDVGLFRNPEDLAYGGTGLPAVRVFQVEVPMAQLWAGYDGDPADTLRVEVYEHWLRPIPSEDA
ncbi:SH3-like domain-containing protein [Poseidonocella sp. HB161398]|uniref:SH3-like domain-containing protein n=1 Tax=Poseidonocella sp. HB161398 TaxID=2320855 RepID=UPI001486530F